MGNVTSHNLTGLSTGTTYYSAVSAYDSDGNESWVSSDLSATPTGASPAAISTSVAIEENTTVQITLSGSDPDGDSLTFSIVSSPDNGSLGPIITTDESTAIVEYTPPVDFKGIEVFYYVANDGHDNSSAATVIINIGPGATPLPIPEPTPTPVPNIWEAPSTSGWGLAALVGGMLLMILIFLGGVSGRHVKTGSR